LFDRLAGDKIIVEEVNMNRETVRLILTEELVMRKIYAKMVPRNLRATAGCATEHSFFI
jgi:hypothetical protein